MKTRKSGRVGLRSVRICIMCILVVGFRRWLTVCYDKINIFFPFTGWLILRLINPFFHRIICHFSLFVIITAMPIMWPCPGHPKCRKIYLYGQGFRAHIASCKHAQSKKVRGRREALETMFSIVCFTESRNLGNITLARRRVPDFRQEPATLCRVWRHCDKRCQRQIHASHLDWIYHRSKHQSEWDR